MWQQVALQKKSVKPWKLLFSDLVKQPLESDYLNTHTPVYPSCSTPLESGNSALLPGVDCCLEATSQVVQTSPSRRSEESCISVSECTASPSKNSSNYNTPLEKRFPNMSNPVTSAATHVMDDDPDATSIPTPANSWWTSMLLSVSQSQPSSSSSTIPELDTLNWSSDLTTSVSNCELVEQLSNSIAIPSASSKISASCQHHICVGSSPLRDSPLSMRSCNLSGGTDSSVWSQVLLASGCNEALQSFNNFQGDGLQDVYSRQFRQSGEFFLSDHVKKIDDMPSWELPPRNFTFQGNDMDLVALEKPSTTSQYPQLIDADRLSSTICTLSDIETWSAAQEHCNAVPPSVSINTFTCGQEPPSTAQFDRARVKQEYPSPRIKEEYPATYGSNIGGTSRPFWMQTGFGVEIYKDDVPSPQLLNCSNRPLFKTLASGSSFASSRSCEEFPGGRWPGTHSSRFSPILPQNLPLIPHVSSQAAPMLSFGSNVSRQLPDFSTFRSDLKPPIQGSATDGASSIHYVQHSIEAKPLVHDFVSSNLRTMGHVDDAKDGSVHDAKRNVTSLNTSECSSEGLFKRPRVEPAPQNLTFKPQVRKEKLGDRITALQQLVSPFGKTDTASVLMEAICYIKFLHDQVQVLSTPYMKTGGSATTQNDSGKKLWGSDKSQDSDEPKLDLRSRGLCLVPVSCTLNVANENIGDYWAPSLGGGYR